MLTVCIALKNRTVVNISGKQHLRGETISGRSIKKLQLFPECMLSLGRALQGIPSEVIVSDFNSADCLPEKWLKPRMGDTTVRLLKIADDKPFSRGTGLNIAAQNARYHLLFFTDTDMLFEKCFFKRALDILASGYAFFPVCYAQRTLFSRQGFWLMHGFGNAMLSRTRWEQFPIPEYNRWGGEDDRFYFEISKRAPVMRCRCAGIYHQWHPTGYHS